MSSLYGEERHKTKTKWPDTKRGDHKNHKRQRGAQEAGNFKLGEFHLYREASSWMNVMEELDDCDKDDEEEEEEEE